MMKECLVVKARLCEVVNRARDTNELPLVTRVLFLLVKGLHRVFKGNFFFLPSFLFPDAINLLALLLVVRLMPLTAQKCLGGGLASLEQLRVTLAPARTPTLSRPSHSTGASVGGGVYVSEVSWKEP